MAQWTMTDEANGAPVYIGALVNKTPNTANRDALYGNTTEDAHVTGKTIGIFGVSANEMNQVAENNPGGVDVILVTNAGTGLTDLDPFPTLSVADGSGLETTVYIGVTNAAITNVGSNVSPGEVISFTTVEAGTPNIDFTVLSVGAVSAVINNRGTGYANTNVISLVGGTGDLIASFNITTGAANDSISTLTLNTAGSYTTIPANSVATLNVTGSGTGATLNVTWGIDEVEITNAGNTSEAPVANTVNVAANAYSANGTGARFTLEFGVMAVAVTNTGEAYTNSSAVTGPAGISGDTYQVFTYAPRAKGNPIPHAGWQVRTVGTGGRAGRVHYETLVAGGSMNDGTSDDDTLPNS